MVISLETRRLDASSRRGKKTVVLFQPGYRKRTVIVMIQNLSVASSA